MPQDFYKLKKKLDKYFTHKKPFFYDLLSDRHQKLITDFKINLEKSDLLNGENEEFTDYNLIRDIVDLINDLINEHICKNKDPKQFRPEITNFIEKKNKKELVFLRIFPETV